MRLIQFLLLVTLAFLGFCSTSAIAGKLIRVESTTIDFQREKTDETRRNLKASAFGFAVPTSFSEGATKSMNWLKGGLGRVSDAVRGKKTANPEVAAKPEGLLRIEAPNPAKPEGPLRIEAPNPAKPEGPLRIEGPKSPETKGGAAKPAVVEPAKTAKGATKRAQAAARISEMKTKIKDFFTKLLADLKNLKTKKSESAPSSTTT